ncbi:MAG: Mov34/MPN/PAD-1 family protein [Promethearchaeia archaeon]
MKYQKDIKIFIEQKFFNMMKECVKKAQPNEACGLLFGNIKEVKVEQGYQYHYKTQRFECIESEKKSPVSFLMNNFEELNRIFQNAFEKHHLRLISIFHSHPSGAQPSGVDTKNMKFLDNCGNRAFKNQIWTIMDARSSELNGFIYFQKEFLEIDVKLVNN